MTDPKATWETPRLVPLSSVSVSAAGTTYGTNEGSIGGVGPTYYVFSPSIA